MTRLFLKNKTHDNMDFMIMSIPGIVFLFIFNYLPLFGLGLAFKNYNVRDGFLNSPWVGFENFKYFLQGPDAFRVTFNTITLNLVFILSSTILQICFALIFNEIGKNLTTMISQSMMFFPYFISWVILGYFVYAILNMDHGMLNKFLEANGLKPVDWYNESRYWPTILAIANAWKYTGFGCVIYIAGLAGINKEYYEAAIVDGAGRWKQVTRISLPLLMPLISILTLLNIGKIMYADFGMFYFLSRDSGPLWPAIDVLDYYIFRALKVSGDIGLASASNFYQAIIGFLLVISTNFIVRKRNSDNALY